MHKFRPLVAVLCLLALTLVIAGCSGAQSVPASSSSDQDEKILVVGCDDFSPFTYRDEAGNVAGIDVEIITEACKRIGYRAECRHIDWEKKDRLLADGKIDCIASCFSMSGRESSYKWAGPYMRSRQVVAVAPESDIKSLADLKGKVIAVRSTTKAESVILSKDNAAMPKVKNVFSFADRSYLVPALLKGYVDAIASHETSILQYEKDYGVDLRILDTPLLETNVGFAFDASDDRGIDAKLSVAIEQMRADGTIRQILQKYLGASATYLEVTGDDE